MTFAFSVAYRPAQGYRHGSRTRTTAPSGRYGGNSTDNYARFHRLLNKWRFDTYFHSLMKETIDDPSFRKIVDMGPQIIPWVINEIRHTPDFLMLALHFVVPNENPVPASSRGKIGEMVDAWLSWFDRTAPNDH